MNMRKSYGEPLSVNNHAGVSVVFKRCVWRFSICHLSKSEPPPPLLKLNTHIVNALFFVQKTPYFRFLFHFFRSPVHLIALS